MQNISGTGVKVILVASVTFPQGLVLTQLADDADPLDIGSIQIADGAMTLNGDLVKWDKANAIPMTLNIIPNTPDDINLQILGNANRVGQGKVSADDVITATVIYPDGSFEIANNGYLKQYMPGNSIASSMRIKTKPYVFEFESKT